MTGVFAADVRPSRCRSWSDLNLFVGWLAFKNMCVGLIIEMTPLICRNLSPERGINWIWGKLNLIGKWESRLWGIEKRVLRELIYILLEKPPDWRDCAFDWAAGCKIIELNKTENWEPSSCGMESFRKSQSLYSSIIALSFSSSVLHSRWIFILHWARTWLLLNRICTDNAVHNSTRRYFRGYILWRH